MLIGLAGLALALVGVVIAMYVGWIDTRASKRRDQQDKDDRDWQLKHEAAALRISRINRTLRAQPPGFANPVMVYPTVFPDPQLRERIERYVVELVDSETRFAPRRPMEHELRSPALRSTVDEVTTILDTCKRENPKLAYYFGD
jgi:hypothetical protein